MKLRPRFARYVFPKARENYIQAVLYHPPTGLYLASCLDMTLKLLDAKLGAVDSVATGQRVIFHLRYNARTRELLAAGASGLHAFRLERRTGARGGTRASLSLIHI